MMKEMKHSIIIAGAFIIALALSCKQEAKEIPVSGVDIAQEDMTLTVGDVTILSATVSPSNATGVRLNWISSDEDIVVVASNGKAKALAAGKAQVRAEAGGASDLIVITVEAAPAPVDPPVDPVIPDPEQSETLAAEKISAFSAVLNGKATPKTTSATVIGFQYSIYAGFLTSNSVIVEKTSSETEYSAGITGLKPDTKYYYRSLLRQDGENYCGETLVFTTRALSSALVTAAASSIEEKSAELNAQLDLTDVIYENVSYGFVWGKKEKELTNVVNGALSGKTFTATLTTLSKGTTYWYKSFVTLDGETFYGELMSFTTPGPTVYQVPIDLGLSVKWASCNLGAQNPEDYGDYYAWGDTEPYYTSLDPLTWKDGKESGYSETNYKWFDSEYKITKYNHDNEYGPVDNKERLDPEDDAVTVALGGGWRMPTVEEITELCDDCTWTTTILNGTNGFNIKGPSGNSIFLPIPGIIDWNELQYQEATGAYWSCSLLSPTIDVGSPTSYIAYILWFTSTGDYDPDMAWRHYGLPIRPVME